MAGSLNDISSKNKEIEMTVQGFKDHPYIPNSVPEVEQAMLKELGLQSLEELHAEVPDEIILKKPMNIPEAFGSEYELRRHVESLVPII